MQVLTYKRGGGANRPTSPKPPATVQVARFSAHHPWLVAGIWIFVKSQLDWFIRNFAATTINFQVCFMEFIPPLRMKIVR
jgi:hypothetical protein